MEERWRKRLNNALDVATIAASVLCALLPGTAWVRAFAGVVTVLLLWRAALAWLPRSGER